MRWASYLRWPELADPVHMHMKVPLSVSVTEAEYTATRANPTRANRNAHQACLLCQLRMAGPGAAVYSRRQRRKRKDNATQVLSSKCCVNGSKQPFHALTPSLPKNHVFQPLQRERAARVECLSRWQTSLECDFVVTSNDHIRPAHTVGSWYRKLISLGLWRLERTNSLSPGGPVTTLVSLICLTYPYQTEKGLKLTLRLRIARQHALYTDTHALDIMHRTPALRIQQVQTYNPVAVDVRVHRDGAVRGREEDDFGRFDGVRGGEVETQAVLVGGRVDGVVEDGNIHLPFFQVGGGDERYAGWEGALDLLEGRGSVRGLLGFL